MRIGKITENALKRSVLKQINTVFKKKTSAAVGTDCAFSEEKRTFSTIVPATLQVSDATYYAVVKAVNGLVSQGVRPDSFTSSVLLPVDAEEGMVKKAVADALEAAEACGVIYAGGHTEVTGSVNRPVITVAATGTVDTDTNEPFFAGKGKAGQSLVVTKWAGLEGTAMLAREKYDDLTTRYPAPFIDDAKGFKDFLFVGEEMEIVQSLGACAVHDLSNGGIFAGLWEMAGRSGTGLRVDLKSIPLRQETVEICEFFELNPYQLLSGGALLIATDNPEQLVSLLDQKGIPSAIIGQLTDGNDKVIINADETRFLESPQADEILKVLG